jgi:membrane protease YdiL (CAAX protease family)
MTDQTPTTRFPHFGHFVLFLSLTALALGISAAGLALTHPHNIQSALTSPVNDTLAQMACYLLTLLAAWFIFPRLWPESFAAGIRWNPAGCRLAFIPLGVTLGFLTQAIEAFLPTPTKAPIEEIFKVPGIIWLLTVFGIVLGPIFEEIVFRGFLFPAIAIAFDYLSLKRSPVPQESLATLDQWRASDSFTLPSLIVSSIITSLAFASLHAPQLGFSWPSVGLLVVVSLILCIIRIRTNSVAASSLVHASYNASVFISLYIATGGYHHLDKL